MKKLTALLLSSLLLLALCGCEEKEEAVVTDFTVNVQTAGAVRGELESKCSYIATVSAEGTARVIPLVSANVESVNVHVGDRVTVGQSLCNLDDTAAQLTLATAQASISAAEAGILSAQAGAQQANAAITSAQQSYNATLAQYGAEGTDSLPVIEEQVRMAEENYDNTQALFEIGAASQIEVDQAYQAMISARAGLQSAKAGLGAAKAGVAQAQAGLGSTAAGNASAEAGMAQAEAAVASAEYQLSLYHLTSPVDGTVEAVNVTENNFAASGTPAFVITTGDSKSATFFVTDEVRKTIQVGQDVSVDFAGKTYTGAVTEVGGVVDAQTGLFKIKASVNDAADLPDGLSVQLLTTAYAQKDAILLPSDALYFEDGDAYVYVARDGKAVYTPVKVALYTADQAAVLEGVLEGDEVICTWSSTLRDGAPIRIAEGSEG